MNKFIDPIFKTWTIIVVDKYFLFILQSTTATIDMQNKTIFKLTSQ